MVVAQGTEILRNGNGKSRFLEKSSKDEQGDRILCVMEEEDVPAWGQCLKQLSRSREMGTASWGVLGVVVRQGDRCQLSVAFEEKYLSTGWWSR